MHFAFICLGNTCRSPFAQAYAAKFYVSRHVFSSWGLRVVSGSCCSAAALRAAHENYGLSLQLHQAQALSAAHLSQIDKWLCMTEAIAQMLCAEFAVPPDRVLLLSDRDVSDPYGESLDVYKDVYGYIAQHIDRMFGN